MFSDPDSPGATRRYADLLDDPAAADLADIVAALDAHTARIAPPAEPPALALPRRNRETIHDTTVSERPRPAAASPATRRPRRAFTGIGAIAAVAAIAALFALVLHAGAPGFSVAGKATPTPTPRALHYLGANGTWEFSTVYKSKQLPAPIAVAPSDPRVMYRPTIDGTLTVQRSDDGGTTWQDLSLPRGDVSSAAEGIHVSVSPLDARTVFAIIGSDASNPHCPPQASQAYSSNGAHIGALALLHPQSGPSYLCTFEYVSTDGGTTWQKPQTPEKGDVSDGALAFQAQDGRLYSLLNPDSRSTGDLGSRLLVSTDGVHWQAADAQLFANGLHVLEFAATPTGTTLFATTIPVNPVGGDPWANRQFWRSDDAGTSWRDLGVFPTTRSDSQGSWLSQLSAAALVDGKALVYYTTAQPVPCGNDPAGAGLPPCAYIPTIHVSVDDGHTWQTSPHAGLPAGQVITTPGSVGVLPDGTIVELFVTQTLQSNGSILYSNPGLYGWKPGASSWSQLTPVISGDALPEYAWLEQPSDTRPAGVRLLISSYDDANGTEVRLGYCQLTQ